MAKGKEFWIKTKSFLKESKRVLQVTRKPNMEEFKTIVKVTGLGVLIIGLIGFIIAITGQLMGI